MKGSVIVDGAGSVTRGLGHCGIEVLNCFVIRVEIELSRAKMAGWLVSREKDGSIGGLHYS